MIRNKILLKRSFKYYTEDKNIIIKHIGITYDYYILTDGLILLLTQTNFSIVNNDDIKNV